MNTDTIPQVLKHGAFEMHFIQEIRFLKAYYWANLGKFAFTPEDRIDWTERAKADFEHLGIPADTYCNPDPESYYHRGLPADLCTNQTEATSGARPVDLEAGAADYSNINNG